MSNKKLLPFILLIIAVGAILRLSFPAVQSRTPDEKHYLNFATAVQADGLLLGVNNLMNLYHTESWRWNYPPPSRVGAYLPAAILRSVIPAEPMKVHVLTS